MYVIPNRPKKKVFGIYTGRIVALVHNNASARYTTLKKKIRSSMSFVLLTR